MIDMMKCPFNVTWWQDFPQRWCFCLHTWQIVFLWPSWWCPTRCPRNWCQVLESWDHPSSKRQRRLYNFCRHNLTKSVYFRSFCFPISLSAHPLNSHRAPPNDGLVSRITCQLIPCPFIALSATVADPSFFHGWLSSGRLEKHDESPRVLADGEKLRKVICCNRKGTVLSEFSADCWKHPSFLDVICRFAFPFTRCWLLW